MELFILGVLLSVLLLLIDWRWGTMIRGVLFRQQTSIEVIQGGVVVPNTIVAITGLGTKTSDSNGITKWFLPRKDSYALRFVRKEEEPGFTVHMFLEPRHKYQFDLDGKQLRNA